MSEENTNGESPSVIVISGANGAGKSTLAPFLLRDALKIFDYVNADTIAAGLSAFAPERAALEAGRIMLKRLRELAAQQQSFAFETTLASRSYKQFLQALQADDYQVHLIFLFLQSADLAVERVRARVRLGGHNVPEETIRRRYQNGLRNFFELYQPIANSWEIYDVSSNVEPVRIARGIRNETMEILNKKLWQQIKTLAK